MNESNAVVLDANPVLQPVQQAAMHPMVTMAMGKGDFSPETLDKLLQVQKDW